MVEERKKTNIESASPDNPIPLIEQASEQVQAIISLVKCMTDEQHMRIVHWMNMDILWALK